MADQKQHDLLHQGVQAWNAWRTQHPDIPLDLSRAYLSKATIGFTVFGNVDLRTVKGLETVTHSGPSTIGTNTISRSEGAIPEMFLRKAGVTESFITYAHSLAQNPIEYYTCFI